MATNNNDVEVSFSYAPFNPIEVKREDRSKYFDEIGLPKYAVQIDPDMDFYIRHKVSLITDPDEYQRSAYILYDLNDIENLNLMTISGYLVDKLDLISPDRIMQVYS